MKTDELIEEKGLAEAAGQLGLFVANVAVESMLWWNHGGEGAKAA